MTKFINKRFSVSLHRDSVAECFCCKKELEQVQYRKNGEAHCLDCFRKGSGKIAEGGLNVFIDGFSTPRWNRGLGCYTSSVRETERIAKSKGLEPIGDSKIKDVFKEKDHRKEIRKELISAHKELHNVGSI